MTDIIRPARSVWLTFDAIEVSDSARPYSATNVVALANSIRELGLQSPLTVIERGGRYLLIAGRHRLEALRILGADKVPVRVVDLDDVEARLWTISENLHRTELSVTERADQIAEWIWLAEARIVSRQVDAKPSREEGVIGRPRGGVRAASRELGISEPEARRAVKIASITPKARQAARSAGLADNQSALLKVAAAPTRIRSKPSPQSPSRRRKPQNLRVKSGKRGLCTASRTFPPASLRAGSKSPRPTTALASSGCSRWRRQSCARNMSMRRAPTAKADKRIGVMATPLAPPVAPVDRPRHGCARGPMACAHRRALLPKGAAAPNVTKFRTSPLPSERAL